MRAISRNLDLIFVQEVPTGTINGSNVTFSLGFAPAFPLGVMGYCDRLPLINGVDYTISGVTITMGAAPALGQDLFFSYMRRN